VAVIKRSFAHVFFSLLGAFALGLLFQALSAASSSANTTTETFGSSAPCSITQSGFSIKINNESTNVTTTNQNNYWIDTQYSGQYGMSGCNLKIFNGSSNITFIFPTNVSVTSVSMVLGAKNGGSASTVFFSDGTSQAVTTTGTCCQVTQTWGGYNKAITKIRITQDSDLYLVDNIIWTAGAVSTPVTVTAAATSVTFPTATTSSFSVGSGLAAGCTITGVTYTYSGSGSTIYPASATPPTNAGTYTITPSASIKQLQLSPHLLPQLSMDHRQHFQLPSLPVLLPQLCQLVQSQAMSHLPAALLPIQ